MRRRDLLALAGAAAVRAEGAPRMRLGTQHAETDEIMRTVSAFGVKHIAVANPSNLLDSSWSVEGLTRLREKVESFGLKLEMISLPTNGKIGTTGIRNVLLGKSPERDREIDGICQMIRNTARAGIPRIKYNLTYLGVVRTESAPGRGSATYSTFDYSRAKQEPPLTEAGNVSEAENWERVTYFLDRVIPVAEEYRVPMALHPHDPAMPRGTAFRGIHRIFGSVDGLKKFIQIHESPYHGLNFCQGTVSEMLERPGEEIYDVIRYFGERKKIFNVHFRNIKGRFLKFQETFPDDGDVDMPRALRVYRDTGYDGMIMPDHAPSIPGDAGHRQAYGFEFGYIAALLQTMRAE